MDLVKVNFGLSIDMEFIKGGGNSWCVSKDKVTSAKGAYGRRMCPLLREV